MSRRPIWADPRLTGRLPDRDYVFNHLVNRIPVLGLRLRAYAALGMQFDEIESAMISLGVETFAGVNLSMGARSSIGQRCYIDARGGIRIDADATVSREACILTATHIVDDPGFDTKIAGVTLGQRSWLGVRAIVLPGVLIGEGAVVGANSVVTADVEPYAVVAGQPARKLRERPGPMDYQVDWRPGWY